jgi:hypothetical protein
MAMRSQSKLKLLEKTLGFKYVDSRILILLPSCFTSCGTLKVLFFEDFTIHILAIMGTPHQALNHLVDKKGDTKFSMSQARLGNSCAFSPDVLPSYCTFKIGAVRVSKSFWNNQNFTPVISQR